MEDGGAVAPATAAVSMGGVGDPVITIHTPAFVEVAVLQEDTSRLGDDLTRELQESSSVGAAATTSPTRRSPRRAAAGGGASTKKTTAAASSSSKQQPQEPPSNKDRLADFCGGTQGRKFDSLYQYLQFLVQVAKTQGHVQIVTAAAEDDTLSKTKKTTTKKAAPSFITIRHGSFVTEIEYTLTTTGRKPKPKQNAPAPAEQPVHIGAVITIATTKAASGTGAGVAAVQEEEEIAGADVDKTPHDNDASDKATTQKKSDIEEEEEPNKDNTKAAAPPVPQQQDKAEDKSTKDNEDGKDNDKDKEDEKDNDKEDEESKDKDDKESKDKEEEEEQKDEDAAMEDVEKKDDKDPQQQAEAATAADKEEDDKKKPALGRPKRGRKKQLDYNENTDDDDNDDKEKEDDTKQAKKTSYGKGKRRKVLPTRPSTRGKKQGDVNNDDDANDDTEVEDEDETIEKDKSNQRKGTRAKNKKGGEPKKAPRKKRKKSVEDDNDDDDEESKKASPSKKKSKSSKPDFETMLERLKEFKAANAHVNVPMEYPQDPQLSRWVKYQRDYQFRGTLPQEQVEALEELGFVWKAVRVTWEDNFEKLKEFQERYHHTHVPSAYPPDQNFSRWVQRQRYKYKTHTLEQDKIEKLQSIGFAFSTMGKGCRGRYKRRTASEMIEAAAASGSTFAQNTLQQQQEKDTSIKISPQDVWQAQFEQLKAFQEEHGHTRVPRYYHKSPSLARFVVQQRNYFNNQKGKLSASQIALLNSIGFEWVLQRSWDDNFQRLVEFKEEHGHANVPADYEEDPKLARWVFRQRMIKKYPQPQERLDKLKSIGFEMDYAEAETAAKESSGSDDKNKKKTAASPGKEPKARAAGESVSRQDKHRQLQVQKQRKLKEIQSKLEVELVKLQEEERKLQEETRALRQTATLAHIGATSAKDGTEESGNIEEVRGEDGDDKDETKDTELDSNRHKQPSNASRLGASHLAYFTATPAGGTSSSTSHHVAADVAALLQKEKFKLQQDRLKLQKERVKLEETKLLKYQFPLLGTGRIVGVTTSSQGPAAARQPEENLEGLVTERAII